MSKLPHITLLRSSFDHIRPKASYNEKPVHAAQLSRFNGFIKQNKITKMKQKKQIIEREQAHVLNYPATLHFLWTHTAEPYTFGQKTTRWNAVNKTDTKDAGLQQCKWDICLSGEDSMGRYTQKAEGSETQAGRSP